MICQEIWLMGKADAAETHLPYELGGKSVQNLNHGFVPAANQHPTLHRTPSVTQTKGIISGRVESLQRLDPAKVARCFRLPERCF